MERKKRRRVQIVLYGLKRWEALMQKLNRAYYLLAVALAVVVLFFAVQNLAERRGAGAAGEAKILDSLRQFPEIKPYANYSANVTFLAQKDISELAEKQPVIYENLTGSALYRVEYSSAGGGLLVIYDAENNTILREFAITNVEI